MLSVKLVPSETPRELISHQPTGGRGAQGGLRIGEMERDAIVGHGISAFVNESYIMLRSDGVSFRICKGDCCCIETV
jgi:DNA-directed RNA polymerase beta subunit